MEIGRVAAKGGECEIAALFSVKDGGGVWARFVQVYLGVDTLLIRMSTSCTLRAVLGGVYAVIRRDRRRYAVE